MMPSQDQGKITASSTPRILGVVLAGGRSSRMGSDKAMLPHASGLTFLNYAIERLSSLVPKVVVSGRLLDPQTQTIECIPDQTPGLGPGIAVWSAVLFAKQQGFDSILVTPVDMPDLESQHLQRLIDASLPGVPTCATFDGSLPHPLVAIYSVSLEHELQCVAESTRRSLRAWLASRAHTLVQLPESAKRDLNSPADLTLLADRHD